MYFVQNKSSQFALPYLSLTLSMFVCLGAMSDVSGATIRLNVQSGEMVLQSREEKLIADLMSSFARSVQQHKPKITTNSLLETLTKKFRNKDIEFRSDNLQQNLIADPGEYLHQTLLNLPPPISLV